MADSEPKAPTSVLQKIEEFRLNAAKVSEAILQARLKMQRSTKTGLEAMFPSTPPATDLSSLDNPPK